MLRIFTNRKARTCDGASRRDFLKVGTLGMSAVTLPALLKARSEAASAGRPTNNKSVIWLWLAGGPTHVETFDPKMTAPAEYRSVNGEVKTPLPGVTIGRRFPQIAQHVDKMALIRSFAHKNSGHGGGTHWLMTGYNNRAADNGGVPNRPSIGSIAARALGPNNPVTGMPNYVRLGNIRADGPAFLGKAYAPFDSRGQAKQNMQLSIDGTRFEDRRNLLGGLDSLRRDVDHTGLLSGMDAFEEQAYGLLLGDSYKAFDLKEEDPKLVERYGKGLGRQMLTARRLCSAGCSFVTISSGGWDMHGKIDNSLKKRAPQVDQAVSALIEDLHQRNMQDDVLLVITGEFGRTPKVNKNAGRDHWAPLSTLALSGGGLRMGQVVGESAPKVDVPATTPIGPQDLMATIFHVLGIDPHVQFTDSFGRPVYMLTDGEKIGELC